jgi:hypothetical protein
LLQLIEEGSIDLNFSGSININMEDWKQYKIRFYQDDFYEVENTTTLKTEFIGSLADCLAYIKLKEEGYL